MLQAQQVLDIIVNPACAAKIGLVSLDLHRWRSAQIHFANAQEPEQKTGFALLECCDLVSADVVVDVRAPEEQIGSPLQDLIPSVIAPMVVSVSTLEAHLNQHRHTHKSAVGRVVFFCQSGKRAFRALMSLQGEPALAGRSLAVGSET